MTSVAKRLLISQGSQSSGSPGSPAPSTHKKMQILATPIRSPMLQNIINDDASEKRNRLMSRLSDVAQLHMGSPSSESKQKPSTANLSGWDVAQISEHLHNCIQLSLENKINMKNAFSLHLIDTLKAMLNKEKETNFQMAGSSLEAGAKIYANRVDALHVQALQVHDQVSQLDKDGNVQTHEANQDEGDDCVEANQQKKKLAKKKKKIIETDLKKMSIPNIEQMPEIDPMLQKLSKEGDASFGGLLLGALRSADDGCALMLDMMCVPEPDAEKVVTNSTVNADFGEVHVYDKVICNTFHKYEFNTSGKHPIFDILNSKSDDLKYNPSEQASYEDDDFDKVDGCDNYNDENPELPPEENSKVFIDFEAKTNSHITATSKLTDGTLQSMMSMISGNGGDYTFFGGMKNLWAGPSYWKASKSAIPGAKRQGDSLSGKPKKSAANKVQYVINFDDENLDLNVKFKKTKAATTVTKTTLERYKKQLLTLPDDLHYKSKDLLQLFTKPQVLIIQQQESKPRDVDGVAESARDYDYSNKNDMDNFCPNISGDSDDNEDYQSSATQAQPTMLDFDDTLVAQPALVERIDLAYAKRPKKVDFKRLKKNMWDLLTKKETNKENFKDSQMQQSSDEKTSFRVVYEKLPALCPGHEAKDLSVPIAFVALLHMCNEKNLLLETTKLFEDLVISLEE